MLSASKASISRACRSSKLRIRSERPVCRASSSSSTWGTRNRDQRVQWGWGDYPPHPILEEEPSYPLLQQCPSQSYSLFQLPQLPLVLTLCADLDLTLVSIEQLQLLLKLLPKGLEFCLLGFIEPQLEDRKI